ncbi:hypothetical protein F5878DRAFT_73322 [Lentinula raphanica]|uniref:Uncharacterized protein n=1 Tax=Lentinula raphanica TaxID=153919 RepID=A0AA38NVV2_9AGAR|nr:hypothetical protein F5878DRAFT_73322 [Lentinula raphanica]
MTSELPKIINNAIHTIRTNAWVNTTRSIRGIVQEKLETEGKLRDALQDWMAENISNEVSGRRYPDEGTLLDIHTTTVLALVKGDVSGVEAALSVYETMLAELKEEYLPIPPPRNLFQLNGSIAATFNTDADDRVKDLSDMSDLTDLSESESDFAGDTRASMKDMNGSTKAFSGEGHNEVFEQAATWNKALRKVIGLAPKEPVDASVTDGVVQTIRAMKKVTRRQYSTEAFRTAIKQECGVTEAMCTICDTMFTVTNRNERILWLAHVYRIGDQLAGILEKWTPSEIVRSWGTESTRFKARQNGGKAIETPKDFIEVFNDHPDYVPGAENLSYCFFLTSFSNFQYNYDIWLGYLLEHLGYDVSAWNNEKDMQDFYGRLIWQIHEWCTQPQHSYEGDTRLTIDVKTFKSKRWKAIIKNTASLRQIVNETSNHAKELTRCINCRGMPASQRCCTYTNRPHITKGLTDEDAEKRLDVLREEMTGAGVTMVPEGEQVKPRVAKSGKQRKRRQSEGTGRIYHPDSIGKTAPFGLDGLEPDKTILERCGHQLLLILNEIEEAGSAEDMVVDWKSLRKEDIEDFVWWRPFDSDKLALLQDAVVDSTGVQPVTRGGQFQSFMGGKMTPIGSRTPSGGRAGDSYTSYAGLEAMTEAGLDILFKQAATSAMMLEAAKVVHPELASQMKKITRECDRVGMTGANIYNCVGYMAPIHQDRDASRGLCVQALLEADTEYREFSFCNIEYQYYIVTSTNCLWSFESSKLHGTMLPSVSTVANLNSHAVDPQRQSDVSPTQIGQGTLWDYTTLAQAERGIIDGAGTTITTSSILTGKPNEHTETK